MGYDIHRFTGEVDDELLCPICSGVLEQPMQAPVCEHAFCSACIQEWISRHPTCPVDRTPITQLRPVARILRNLLSRLSISCENSSYGCSEVLKLDALAAHCQDCEHNPKKPVPCELGCGLIIPMDELKEHNCVRELRALVQKQEVKLQENQTELSDLRFQLNEQKRELIWVKEVMTAVRVRNPVLRAVTDERDQLMRWSSSLARARVTRWGGMISTPDDLLQGMIKASLLESGCPSQVVEDLMEMCHERAWPPGLKSLETRQANRRQYESYLCKRIPGKQAVVVLHCDNSHVSDDMMAYPGLVMIFAHGIE